MVFTPAHDVADKAENESRICYYFNKPGGCFRGEECPFEHTQPLDHGVFTRDKRLVYCVDDTENTVALPDRGSWVLLEVTTILTPGHFFCIFPYGTRPFTHLLQEEGNGGDEGYEGSLTNISESLEALGDAMNEDYNRLPFRDTDLIVLALGEIVAALFSYDQRWYRARVIDREPDDMRVQVYFLDFGNREWLPESSIRQMAPKFMHLPYQSVECFLPLNPIAENGQWSAESRKLFREHVDGIMLYAFVLYSGCGVLTLELYSTQSSQDVNVADVLVSEKHAVRAEEAVDSSRAGTLSRSYSSNSSVNIKEVVYYPG